MTNRTLTRSLLLGTLALTFAGAATAGAQSVGPNKGPDKKECPDKVVHVGAKPESPESEENSDCAPALHIDPEEILATAESQIERRTAEEQQNIDNLRSICAGLSDELLVEEYTECGNPSFGTDSETNPFICRILFRETPLLDITPAMLTSKTKDINETIAEAIAGALRTVQENPLPCKRTLIGIDAQALVADAMAEGKKKEEQEDDTIEKLRDLGRQLADQLKDKTYCGTRLFEVYFDENHESGTKYNYATQKNEPAYITAVVILFNGKEILAIKPDMLSNVSTLKDKIKKAISDASSEIGEEPDKPCGVTRDGELITEDIRRSPEGP